MSAAAVLAGAASWSIEQGDVRARLRELPDGCVNLTVCSPPYMNLRAYGTAPQIWGGRDDCAHDWQVAPVRLQTGGTGAASAKQLTSQGTQGAVQGVATTGTCTRCNAWRGELGAESRVQDFVAHLVEVFQAVRRVLRDDGVLFVNLSDSFAGSGKGGNGGWAERGEQLNGNRGGRADSTSGTYGAPTRASSGIPAKSLCLVPERFVLAMQEAGWIVRDRIAWVKQSCMPESVRDRCTQSWEHIYMFTKRPNYWWDAEAIRTPHIGEPHTRFGKREAGPRGVEQLTGNMAPDAPDRETNPAGANCRNAWILGPEPQKAFVMRTRVDVSVDDADDDTERTTSPDCPIHGRRRGATAPDGGLRADPSIGTERNGAHPALAQHSAPDTILPHTASVPAQESCAAPVEPRHSTPSSRTAPHAETNLPCTASGETAAHTGDMSAQPDGGSQHLGTPVSNIVVDHGADAMELNPLVQTVGDSASTQGALSCLGEPAPVADQETVPRNSDCKTLSVQGDPLVDTGPDTPRKSSCLCSYSRVIIQETAHYASFPTEIPRRAILAACPPRCCAVCGAGWRRVTERTHRPPSDQLCPKDAAKVALGFHGDRTGLCYPGWRKHPQASSITIGWQPGCAHDADTRPGICLDPFSGSGTTGLVATRLGRRYIGVELNEQYAEMSRARIRDDAPLLEAAAPDDGWQQSTLFGEGASA